MKIRVGKRELQITEYLYVDMSRLESYSKQICSAGTYEKVPSWSVSFGLPLGIKAEGKDTAYLKTPSTHEEICKVVVALEKSNMITEGRMDLADWSSDTAYGNQQFWMENCEAVRVYLPPKGGASEGKGLFMWISLYAGGNLYLLEDLPQNDLARITGWSSYTALTILMREFDEIGQTTQLTLPELLSRENDFSKEPISVLNQLGAQIGTKRKINTLYRLRSVLKFGINEPGGAIPSFGYPIYIAAL